MSDYTLSEPIKIGGIQTEFRTITDLISSNHDGMTPINPGYGYSNFKNECKSYANYYSDWNYHWADPVGGHTGYFVNELYYSKTTQRFQSPTNYRSGTTQLTYESWDAFQKKYNDYNNKIIGNVKRKNFLVVPRFVRFTDGYKTNLSYEQYTYNTLISDVAVDVYYIDHDNKKVVTDPNLSIACGMVNATINFCTEVRGISDKAHEKTKNYNSPFCGFSTYIGRESFRPSGKYKQTTFFNDYYYGPGGDWTNKSEYIDNLMPRIKPDAIEYLDIGSIKAPSNFVFSFKNEAAKATLVKYFLETIGLPYMLNPPKDYNDVIKNASVPNMNNDGSINFGKNDNWQDANHMDDVVNDLKKGDEDGGGEGGAIAGDETEDNLPTLGTLGVFNRCFAMNANQVNALVDDLWSADDTVFQAIIDGLALLGGNPIEGIIDLRLYPFSISQFLSTSNTSNIIIGRTKLPTATGQKLNTNACAVIDLGSITIGNKYNNFMDFEPFSRYKLYVPYCGGCDLPANLVVGHTIKITMYVDLNTGSANAVIKIDGRNFKYVNGTIGVSIPVTSNDAANYATSIIQAGANTINTAANAVGGTIGNALKGNVGGAITSGITGAVNTAVSAMDFSTKLNDVDIQMQGTASPSCSLYNPNYCYLLREYHAPIIPSNYGHCVGYECRVNGNLSSMSGYTVFADYDLSNCTGTDDEKKELSVLLRAGVYC